MHGCKPDGTIDDSDFSNPLPWIGVYVALFSLVCAVLMGFDLAEGFRRRRHWFPCRLFSLNATTLTLLGIAVKLPADLNTAMPGRWDQLSKLTGAVLVCTAMGNIMPSLGVTDDIFSNTVALAILVITDIGNITTQLSTGVIYSFHPEHYIVLSFMLVLLAITITSALIVSTTKKELEEKYNKIYRKQKRRNSDEDLEMTVDKYWLMAHTSSPQYVLGRSATCTASGVFCLLGAVVLIQAVCRSFSPESRRSFCAGESDYEWSSTVVFVSQMITICVGTVAPAWRCLSAVGFRGGQIGGWSALSLEKYWFRMLNEIRESRLEPWIDRRWFRKAGRVLRNSGLRLLIVMQVIVVVFSKVVALLSLLIGIGVWNLCRMMRPLGMLLSVASSVCSVDAENPNPDWGRDEDFGADLSDFVLHLEGEDQLVKLIMKSGRRDSQKSIQDGRDRPPVHLRELIITHSSVGFQRIGRCGLHQISPNCWALPLVTLASIALAMPGIDRAELKALRRGVGEGLRYVRLVDKHLDVNGQVNAAAAADILWDQVDLFGRWFETKLYSQSGRGHHVDILIRLENMGIQEELRGGKEIGPDPVNWPPRMLAGRSMQTMARAIREGDGVDLAPEGLFRWLRAAIADVLGACLTNIPKAVWMECICNRAEEREGRVEQAAFLLGQFHELWQFLSDRARDDQANSCPPKKKRPSIDAWGSRPELR